MIAMGLLAIISTLVLEFLIPALKAQARGSVRVDVQEQALVACGKIVADLEGATPGGIGIQKNDGNYKPEVLTVHKLMDASATDPPRQIFANQVVVYFWMPNSRRIGRATWPPDPSNPPSNVAIPTPAGAFRPAPAQMTGLASVGPNDSWLGADVTSLNVTSAVNPPLVGPPINVTINFERQINAGEVEKFQIQRSISLRNSE